MFQIGPREIGADLAFGVDLALFILQCNIALVLKITEMKFNARGNLASWLLAYVKYIKILQLILDTGEQHHTK